MIELQFILRAAHTENPEAVDFRDELWRSLGHEIGVGFKEHVRKACSKVGAVDV